MFQVLGALEDGKGLRLVPEMEPRADPLAVVFGDVRVLQSFSLRNGGVTKVLLLPDCRGIN